MKRGKEDLLLAGAQAPVVSTYVKRAPFLIGRYSNWGNEYLFCQKMHKNGWRVGETSPNETLLSSPTHLPQGGAILIFSRLDSILFLWTLPDFCFIRSILRHQHFNLTQALGRWIRRRGVEEGAIHMISQSRVSFSIFTPNKSKVVDEHGGQ